MADEGHAEDGAADGEYQKDDGADDGKAETVVLFPEFHEVAATVVELGLVAYHEQQDEEWYCKDEEQIAFNRVVIFGYVHVLRVFYGEADALGRTSALFSERGIGGFEQGAAAQPGEEVVEAVEVFGEFDADALLVREFGAGIEAGVGAVEAVEVEGGVEAVAYFDIADEDVARGVFHLGVGVAVAECVC